MNNNTGTGMIEDLTVLNDLRDRLASVTDAQIAANERRMGKSALAKGEVVIGVITDRTARALFTLVEMLRSESKLKQAESELADEEMIADDLKKQSVILSELADVGAAIQWAQFRSITGFWKGCSVGMRGGWQFVERPPQGMFPPGLRGISIGLGGPEGPEEED